MLSSKKCMELLVEKFRALSSDPEQDKWFWIQRLNTYKLSLILNRVSWHISFCVNKSLRGEAGNEVLDKFLNAKRGSHELRHFALMMPYYIYKLEDFIIYRNYNKVFVCDLDTLKNVIAEFFGPNFGIQAAVSESVQMRVKDMIYTHMIIDLIYTFYSVINLDFKDFKERLMYQRMTPNIGWRQIRAFRKAALTLSDEDIEKYRQTINLHSHPPSISSNEITELSRRVIQYMCHAYHEYLVLIGATAMSTLLETVLMIEPNASRNRGLYRHYKNWRGQTYYSTKNRMSELDMNGAMHLISILKNHQEPEISFVMKILHGFDVSISV